MVERTGDGGSRIRPLAELLLSLRYLTRLPIPFARTLDMPPLAQAMRFFAVAGAVVGALSGAVLVLLNLAGLPSLLAAVLAVGVGAIITGAIHEDGIADMADGFGGGSTREERLEIMHDSRIGAYGTIALMITLLARVVVFEAMLGLEPLSAIVLISAAAAFSRAMMVDVLWATRPAGEDDRAHLLGRPTRNTTLVALISGGLYVAFAGGYFLERETGIIALIAALLITAGLRALSMRLIGGQTRDVLGGVQILSEIAMLTVFVSSSG
jgi:adenosylcobinamide-GDP ribazoletransferase